MASPASTDKRNRYGDKANRESMQVDETLSAMMNAPHNIVLHATALGDRCSISDPAAYVGFKLIATMARQMHTTLQAPAIALQ